jgi:hypothetical protein
VEPDARAAPDRRQRSVLRRAEDVGSLDEIEGYLTDTRVTLEWDLLDPLTFGIGWNLFTSSVDLEQSRLELDFDYRYQGVLFYAGLNF